MSALHNTSDTARQSASNTRRANTGTRTSTSTISRSSAQQSSNRKTSSGRQDSRKPAAKPAAPREKRYEIPRHFKMFRPGEPMPPSFEVLASSDNEVSSTAHLYRLAVDRFISECKSQGANGAINISVIENFCCGKYCDVSIYGTPVIFGVASSRGKFSSEGLLEYYLPNRHKAVECIEENKKTQQEKVKTKEQKLSNKAQAVIFLFLILTLLLLMK